MSVGDVKEGTSLNEGFREMQSPKSSGPAL